VWHCFVESLAAGQGTDCRRSRSTSAARCSTALAWAEAAPQLGGGALPRHFVAFDLLVVVLVPEFAPWQRLRCAKGTIIRTSAVPDAIEPVWTAVSTYRWIRAVQLWGSLRALLPEASLQRDEARLSKARLNKRHDSKLVPVVIRVHGAIWTVQPIKLLARPAVVHGSALITLATHPKCLGHSEQSRNVAGVQEGHGHSLQGMHITSDLWCA
jgi:hypothetical protein